MTQMAAQASSECEGACPALPNWRSAMLVERNRQGVLSQRTAMLDDSDVRTSGICRQRTAVVGEIWASRTAMMLPHMLGSEGSHISECQPKGWSVVRVASGARSTLQNMLSMR